MKRLLAGWFDRLRGWCGLLIRCQERQAGSLCLLRAARPAAVIDPPPWALPVEALARQARREGAAAIARLAGRLPAGASALGEWRGDNGDVLRVLAAWRGWPEQAGRREINHWLWLARRPQATLPASLAAASADRSGRHAAASLIDPEQRGCFADVGMRGNACHTWLRTRKRLSD